MTNYYRFIASIVICFVSFCLYAHDFEVDGIYYSLTSSSTVSVTYRGSKFNSYSGHIEIPSTVEYENRKFEVTEIGTMAFDECENLYSVTIPNSISKIGNSAFSYCYNLRSIDIPLSVTDIGKKAFYECRSLQEILIPEAITGWQDYLFYGCTSLKSIRIPEGVTSIGDCCFFNCQSLKEIDLPNTIISMGQCTFYGCKNLKSIVIPNEITNIPFNCLSDCVSLQTVVFGERVKKFSGEQFWNCGELQTLVCLNPIPPTCESRTFKNISRVKVTLYVPTQSIDLYKNAPEWEGFFNIIGIESESNDVEWGDCEVVAQPYVENGMIFVNNADGQELYVYGIDGTNKWHGQNYDGRGIFLNPGIYIVRIGAAAIKVEI